MNQYPGHRDFKAIGSGGDDFKQAIVRAVENIVGPVQQDRVLERPSSQGKFISITLRDVRVQNPAQVSLHCLVSAEHAILKPALGTHPTSLPYHIGMLHTGTGSICCDEKGQTVEILPLRVSTAASVGNQSLPFN